MRIPRIFGVVVFLHVLVILIVLVQPGCRTKNDPPTVGSPPPPVSDDPTLAMDPYLADDFNPVASGRAAPAPAPAPGGAGVTTGGRQPPTRPTVNLQPGATTGPATRGVEPLVPTRTHTVARGDSPWKISQQYGISLDELLEANNLGRSSTIQPGQVLVIPTRGGATAGVAAPAPGGAAPAPVAAAPAPATPAITYTVRAGDTLSAIAARHNTTVAAIQQLNRLSGAIIRPGQVLTIPPVGGAPATPAAGVGTAPAPAAAAADTLGGATHTVASGETLGAIARRYSVTVEALQRANNISDPRRLQVGQVLVIPGGTAPVAARPVSPAPGAAPAPAPAPAFPAPARPMTPEELDAQNRLLDDVEVLPVEDAPLVPVPAAPRR